MNYILAILYVFLFITGPVGCGGDVFSSRAGGGSSNQTQEQAQNTDPRDPESDLDLCDCALSVIDADPNLVVTDCRAAGGLRSVEESEISFESTCDDCAGELAAYGCSEDTCGGCDE